MELHQQHVFCSSEVSSDGRVQHREEKAPNRMENRIVKAPGVILRGCGILLASTATEADVNYTFKLAQIRTLQHSTGPESQSTMTATYSAAGGRGRLFMLQPEL